VWERQCVHLLYGILRKTPTMRPSTMTSSA
jgi:hypothetical protein